MIERALTIKGWMSHNELMWLADRASKHHTIVEVGSYCGRSTRALGDNCPGVVHAVDSWPDVAAIGPRQTTTDCDIRTYDIFKLNLDDLLQTGAVIAHRSKFVEGLFPAKSIDMVFIDGDHTEKAVLDDIQVALKVLKPGGLLCGHDYDVVSKAVYSSLTGVQRMRAPKSGSIWWTNDTQS